MEKAHYHTRVQLHCTANRQRGKQEREREGPKQNATCKKENHQTTRQRFGQCRTRTWGVRAHEDLRGSWDRKSKFPRWLRQKEQATEAPQSCPMSNALPVCMKRPFKNLRVSDLVVVRASIRKIGGRIWKAGTAHPVQEGCM